MRTDHTPSRCDPGDPLQREQTQTLPPFLLVRVGEEKTGEKSGVPGRKAGREEEEEA